MTNSKLVQYRVVTCSYDWVLMGHMDQQLNDLAEQGWRIIHMTSVATELGKHFAWTLERKIDE